MNGISAAHSIGIIGTGRVAQALALALGKHSSALPLIWGRSTDKSKEAATRIGHAKAVDTLSSLASSSDIVAIAVSDDAVGPIAARLAPLLHGSDRTPFVFHVSGRSGTAILDPLREMGALTAAIHPAMTFTGNPREEVVRMAGACFAVTGSSDLASDLGKRIVSLLGGNAVEIAEDRRALYHAALCHAANHLVTLLEGSSQILSAAGVHEPHAVLAPLVRAAMENSLTHGFDALSGPVLRGDRETIAGHIAALGEYCSQALPAYRAMALATIDELEAREAPVPLAAVREELG
ncbi:Rossmann-like and DUF2520 domain-containing protein [Novosphingobium pentaromativorans]|uniref:Putative cytoplasmic protein n=1 Tax=Novosphingobium pentaromativorans US6-1 TaxID=1088721 RepID=G6EH64_9SPHN|nr:DUF2520 domain-containing protein [Novosphingobium pentaromativorans]AIT81962.1 cytoplasmic protein [Novosphingobium pentaromativorans US6-1]EHJ59353.1 putative cytoplasmic protein [Novosphingobium pentaromativorans US6-1]